MLKKFIINYGALILIIGFASIQFILILRHKSPYLSDSYFYKHIYYQLKGDSFETSRNKIINQVDLSITDEITTNIFTNEIAYKNSYEFFIKRPLYPILAMISNIITTSEYLTLLLPIFIAYIGSVFFGFILLSKGLNYIAAIFSSALFISFYPFLDWSTYFMTDTIGYMFWLTQTILIYFYIKLKKKIYILLFAITLIFSLLNREQSILIISMLLMLYTLIKVKNVSKNSLNRVKHLLIFSLLIVSIYLYLSFITNQKNLLETIVYTQNKYGLYDYTYSINETMKYMVNSIIFSHIAFIGDLTRNHWWFVIFILGIFGMIKMLISKKNYRLIDLVIFTTGVSSYFAIYLYPVLSYRFFYPVVLSLIYFAVQFSIDYFKLRIKLIKESLI